MVAFKDFDEDKLVQYSSSELKTFINEIEMGRSVIAEKCASEMAVYLKDDKFDVYSFSGSRKMKKIAKKYQGAFAGADIYLTMLKKELAKREKEDDELRYSGRSLVKRKQETEEEFLQKEQDKTWAYRSKIE